MVAPSSPSSPISVITSRSITSLRLASRMRGIRRSWAYCRALSRIRRSSSESCSSSRNGSSQTKVGLAALAAGVRTARSDIFGISCWGCGSGRISERVGDRDQMAQAALVHRADPDRIALAATLDQPQHEMLTERTELPFAGELGRLAGHAGFGRRLLAALQRPFGEHAHHVEPGLERRPDLLAGKRAVVALGELAHDLLEAAEVDAQL